MSLRVESKSDLVQLGKLSPIVVQEFSKLFLFEWTGEEPNVDIGQKVIINGNTYNYFGTGEFRFPHPHKVLYATEVVDF